MSLSCARHDARFLLPRDERARLVSRRDEVPPGYRSRTFAAVPSLAQPVLFVPTDRTNVARYALRTWTVPKSRRRALRKQVLVRVARPVLARRGALTVASPVEADPFVLETAAKRFDLGSRVDWLLLCGQGDELARCAFVVFSRGARTPEWIVKFSRAKGYADPFDRDEHAAAIVAAAGGQAARRAPKFLGRFTADGHEASVETAATGSTLGDLLEHRHSRHASRRLIDAIAGWIIDVALETRAGAAVNELERIRHDVLPYYSAGPELLDGLDQIGGVLQHNDLGSWNIVAEPRRDEFTVLDWESARACGLPLWDLWYFLADALRALDASPAEDPRDAFRRLFRGEAPSSPLLFSWTRRAVERLRIPANAVGRLATLCWLHHGRSHLARGAALEEHGGEAAVAIRWNAQDYPDIWLDDALLGAEWSAWASGR